MLSATAGKCSYLARKPEGNRPYWNGYSEKYRAEHGFRRPGARGRQKKYMASNYRAHHQHIGNYADQARIKRLSVAVHSCFPQRADLAGPMFFSV